MSKSPFIEVDIGYGSRFIRLYFRQHPTPEELLEALADVEGFDPEEPAARKMVERIKAGGFTGQARTMWVNDG